MEIGGRQLVTLSPEAFKFDSLTLPENSSISIILVAKCLFDKCQPIDCFQEA